MSVTKTPSPPGNDLSPMPTDDARRVKPAPRCGPGGWPRRFHGQKGSAGQGLAIHSTLLSGCLVSYQERLWKIRPRRRLKRLSPSIGHASPAATGMPSNSAMLTTSARRRSQLVSASCASSDKPTAAIAVTET